MSNGRPSWSRALSSARRARCRIGVVRVALVGLDADGNRALVHEPREVVDVAVGVVALDAVAQPHHVLLPVVVAQVALDVASSTAPWVAILVQQARRRRQHGAGAVEVDRAAFHDDARIEHRQAQLLGNPRRHRIVRVVRRVLAAPRVEAPVDDRRLGLAATRAQHEGRTMIAGPALVGLDVMEVDAAAAAPCARRRNSRTMRS